MTKKRKRSLPRNVVFRQPKRKAPAFVRAPEMPVPRSLRLAYHIESDEAVDMAIASGLPAPVGYEFLTTRT